MYSDLKLIAYLSEAIGLDGSYNSINCGCGKEIDLNDYIYDKYGNFKFNFKCDCGVYLDGIVRSINDLKVTYKTNIFIYDIETDFNIDRNMGIKEIFLYKDNFIPDWVPKIRISDNKIIGELSKGIISEVILKFDREYGKELMKYLK